MPPNSDDSNRHVYMNLRNYILSLMDSWTESLFGPSWNPRGPVIYGLAGLKS